MDCTRGDEYAARYAGFKGRLEKLDRAREIRAEEEVGRSAIFTCAVARASPLDGRVDQRVSAVNQSFLSISVAQLSGEPFDGIGYLLKAASIATGSIPTY